MRLDRLGSDEQGLGDLAVGHTFGRHACDVMLSGVNDLTPESIALRGRDPAAASSVRARSLSGVAPQR
jgi:hypothetical protein